MLELTKDLLNEIFSYDPETGVLTHKERPRWMFTKGYKAGETSWRTFNTQNAGNAVDNRNHGYLRVNICGKRYSAHRIIWCMVYGEWPEEVDHINGDRGDNRLCNLRAVSRQENMRNTRIRNDSSTGVTGVSYSKRDDVFIAYIGANKKTKILGRFATIEDAVAARKAAEAELGYHENHGRAA